MSKSTFNIAKKRYIFYHIWSTIALYLGRTPTYGIYGLIGLYNGYAMVQTVTLQQVGLMSKVTLKIA